MLSLLNCKTVKDSNNMVDMYTVCKSHIFLMDTVHLLYYLPLYHGLKEGHRKSGGQNKHFKDTLKANLKKCKINVEH